MRAARGGPGGVPLPHPARGAGSPRLPPVGSYPELPRRQGRAGQGRALRGQRVPGSRLRRARGRGPAGPGCPRARGSLRGCARGTWSCLIVQQRFFPPRSPSLSALLHLSLFSLLFSFFPCSSLWLSVLGFSSLPRVFSSVAASPRCRCEFAVTPLFSTYGGVNAYMCRYQLFARVIVSFSGYFPSLK